MAHLPEWASIPWIQRMRELQPEMFQKFVEFEEAVYRPGKLSRKFNILVKDANIALRGLFIIDPEGVLQYSVVQALNIGRSVDETLRVLQGLQTGGLCAADWKPGQENLKV